MRAVWNSSIAESVETPTLFSNDVARKMLQAFMGYDAKKKDKGYGDGTIMSIARLNSWVKTVVRCLGKWEKSEGHRQKEYGNTYARRVGTATKQLILFRVFLRNMFCEEVTVERDGLCSGERRDAVMGMSRSVTNMWTLPSVKKTSISVEWR